MPKDRHKSTTKEHGKDHKRSREDDAGGESSRKRKKDSKRQRSSPAAQPRSASKADEPRRDGRGSEKRKEHQKESSRRSPAPREKPHILERVNVRRAGDSRKADVSKPDQHVRSRAPQQAPEHVKLIETEEDFWKRAESQQPILKRVGFRGEAKPAKRSPRSAELISRSPSPVAALTLPKTSRRAPLVAPSPAMKPRTAAHQSKHRDAPSDAQPAKQRKADRSHAERSTAREERRRSRSRERSRERSSEPRRQHKRRHHSPAAATPPPRDPAPRGGVEMPKDKPEAPPHERHKRRKEHEAPRREWEARRAGRQEGSSHDDRNMPPPPHRDNAKKQKDILQKEKVSRPEKEKEKEKEGRGERRQKESRKREKREDRERDDRHREGREQQEEVSGELEGRERHERKREEERKQREGNSGRRDKRRRDGSDEGRDGRGHGDRHRRSRSERPERGRKGERGRSSRRDGSVGVLSISSGKSSGDDERGGRRGVKAAAHSQRAVETASLVAVRSGVQPVCGATAERVSSAQTAEAERVRPPKRMPDRREPVPADAPPYVAVSPKPQRRSTPDATAVRASSDRGAGGVDGRAERGAAMRQQEEFLPAAPPAGGAGKRRPWGGSPGPMHEGRAAPQPRQDHSAPGESRFWGSTASGFGGIRGTSNPGGARGPVHRASPPRSDRPLPPPPPQVLPGPPRAAPAEPLGHFMPRQQHTTHDEALQGSRRGPGQQGEGMMGDLMGDGVAQPRRDGAAAWGGDRAAGGGFVQEDDISTVGDGTWGPLLEEGLGEGTVAQGWAATEVPDGYLAGTAAEQPAVQTPVQLPGYTVQDSAGLRAQMAVWKQAAKGTLRSAQLQGGAVAEVFARLDAFLGGSCVDAVVGGERLRRVPAVQRHCGGAGLAGWLPVHNGRRNTGGEAEWDEEQWRLEVRESSDAVFACSEALKREREAGWCAMGSDGAFVHGVKEAAVVFAGGGVNQA